MTPYQIHHLNFLKIAYNNFIKNDPFTREDLATDDEQFIHDLKNLIEDFEAGTGDIRSEGQDVIDRAFRMYPELAHLIARDLLWYFGGSCLHNMPEDEIEKFQRLDEMSFEAEEEGKDFDYLAARSNVFGTN
ncbi:PA2817 family protein [Pontibacterium sp.]|uniref:PA2817 family protein n=1 Tax=Pontibacterium sp. TaxID=2036026 RepID=UPI0035180983